MGATAGASAGLALPLPSGAVLDRGRGMRRGARVGALVGGLGLSGTYILLSDEHYTDLTLILGAFGAVIGAAAGGLAGALLGAEREGREPPGLELRLRPQRVDGGNTSLAVVARLFVR